MHFWKSTNNFIQLNIQNVGLEFIDWRCLTPLISVISWWFVLLVEETKVPKEYHWHAKSHWKIYLIMLYIEHLSPWAGFDFKTLVVKATDCTVSIKFNYDTIMTLMTPTKYKYVWKTPIKNVCNFENNNL